VGQFQRYNSCEIETGKPHLGQDLCSTVNLHRWGSYASLPASQLGQTLFNDIQADSQFT